MDANEPQTALATAFPFTPFTSNPFGKPNPFNSPGMTAPHLPLLDDSDDSLAGLYNQLLRQVEKDCGSVLETAERINARTKSKNKKVNVAKVNGVDGPVNGHHARPSDVGLSMIAGDGDGFDVMANVIWAEIGRALMQELGSTLFAAGRPDEFQRVRFVSRCPSYDARVHFGCSIIRRQRILSRRSSFWHLLWMRSTQCAHIRRIWRLRSGGNSLFTSSCGGRISLGRSRMRYPILLLELPRRVRSHFNI